MQARTDEREVLAALRVDKLTASIIGEKTLEIISRRSSTTDCVRCVSLQTCVRVCVCAGLGIRREESDAGRGKILQRVFWLRSMDTWLLLFNCGSFAFD